MGKPIIHPSAVIDQPCEIGEDTSIWHFSHIMVDAHIGSNCSLGQNVFVASHVVVGDNVRIQNNVSLYTGVIIEDYVFCGPSCVFTNVINPRAEFNRKSEYQQTLVCRGASIGANATILCGVTIGRYAFIGAGAVVTEDVPDYALMTGVPARQTGWISRHGQRLTRINDNGVLRCPQSGWLYQEESPGRLRCLTWSEDLPLLEGGNDDRD